MLACFGLNRRSELRGDMWHLRHSNPHTKRRGGGGGGVAAARLEWDTSGEGPGSTMRTRLAHISLILV